MKKGTSVKVIKPDYAAGVIGVIEGYEEDSKRWIIKLEKKKFLNDKYSTIRLSLPTSDFKIIS